ncbi:FAD-binding protein [Variovorax sp. KK3]|uniref:FAD-binding protein n=1 Tax=Variovorax sp. KK3 TaxID=1855728 RepID=UPI0009FA64AA|nr:FAD-binding protein [Variovorax sp. KK3]
MPKIAPEPETGHNGAAVEIALSGAPFDLIILGAGAGGMATALVAALEGLKPLVIERTDQVGGTAATSAGTIWIPGNRQSADAGWYDDPKNAARYLDQLIGDGDRGGLRTAYLATGPVMVDYLRQKSEVRFNPSGKHPDYHHMDGAAVHGRTLYPERFDGRRLGPDFWRVRPPIPEFLIFGGMMAGKEDVPRLIHRFRSMGNFLHAGGLLLRYLKDRLTYSRGTRLVMGNALVARLFHSLRQNGVPVLFEGEVQDLIRRDDTVAGVVVRVAGELRRIEARHGVVVATGGYGHHAGLRQALMPNPTPMHTMASPGNTGGGLELGMRNGGQVDARANAPGGFWVPVSVTRRADGTSGLFPHLLLDRAKPGLIAVNGKGERFVNEASSYHDFVQGMYASHTRTKTIPAYLLCEADFIRKYGLGHIHPGTRRLQRFSDSGYIVVAPSIEALATQLGIDGQALRATVERYNRLAREGKDFDFGKGDTELNRFNGDPEAANPCLAPIEKGPFVALEVWPAEIATSAGLRTDADARVLDAQEKPVDGLYAVGNDMASVMAGTYPGPGTTLGPALTFGFRAAMHAAARAKAVVPEPPSAMSLPTIEAARLAA